MNKIKIIDLKATIKQEVELDKKLLPRKSYQQAIFDQILAENNAKRQGTHSTLTKAEVRGGGKKPRPQKHSGRARQGSIRNPQWVGGGVVFGPKPTRNYKYYLNSKASKSAAKAAICFALTNSNCLILDDTLDAKKLKTKDFAQISKKLKITGRSLFVVDSKQESIIKKVANLAKTDAKKVDQVSVNDWLKPKNIIVTKSVWDKLMEVLK